MAKATLTFADKLKAAKWLESNADRLKEKRPSNSEVARDLENLLQSPVTDAVVAGLRRDTGVNWVAARSRPNRANAVRWGRQRRLTIASCKILELLGEKVPAMLLRDAELTAEELSSGTLEDLIEAAIDETEQAYESNGKG